MAGVSAVRLHRQGDFRIMMMRATKISFLTILLCAFSTAAVQAQTPPLPPPPATAPAPAPAGKPSPTQAAVEQRIAALQTKLAITPDQQAAWSAFAQVMRDNAQNTDTLFNTQHLSDAFATLYAKLSRPQQQAADTLFRQPAASPARRR
jgi:protein CpxP